MNRSEAERTLRIISRAWGKKQSGYVFFPYIDREEQRRTGSRKAGYHEGPNPKNPAFKWPADRERILDHMLAHQHHDLYFCPSVFEYPWRREDVAADEHALWADLDEVNPEVIRDYPPTIAWESSPGRYQALWIAATGDMQGASWPGNENQRLTYHLGADRSGWDTTQLLRVPGWTNHKPEYKDAKGKYPQGKLLWSNGQTYIQGDFADLPALATSIAGTELTDALELEIVSVDRSEVLGRIRLDLSQRIRELLNAKEGSGDRSNVLWDLERSLADVGCSVAEIVAVIRPTVWNKYDGRADELKRLIMEASKAIAAKPETPLEDEEPITRPHPQRLGEMLKHVKPPRWVVDKLFTEGACGFIAGEPKCYKSWNALDLALSIATGAPFLGYFNITRPGPVLYIQEEDPKPTIKSRTGKIWSGKVIDKVVLTPDALGVEWLPPEQERVFDPDVMSYVQEGFTISDEAWQEWLDNVLSQGMGPGNTPYRAVIIDTLMMVAGDVEENKAQVMTTKVFKPLKQLSRKHNVLVLVVHHLNKSDRPRAGSRLLGSVANHAWAEDSIYLHRTATRDIRMETESKTAAEQVYRLQNLDNAAWEPAVSPWKAEEPAPKEYTTPKRSASKSSGQATSTPRARAKPISQHPVVKALRSSPHPLTAGDIAGKLTKPLSRGQVWRQLVKAEEQGLLTRTLSTNNTYLWSSLP